MIFPQLSTKMCSQPGFVDIKINFFPEIKLVRLETNVGKTDAIREGLKHTRGEFIILIDADLQHLNHAEIDKAIRSFQEDGKIDMLILRRVRADLIVRLYRGDVLFTGERILKKKDLLEVLRGPVKRWQLESAVNTWMYKRKKRVLWMRQSAVNTDKALKWGLLKGLIFDMKTLADMIFATGAINFIRQILYYAKEELKDK